ncbi:hypothetical protein PRIPAC_96614 [Pristionchus pacificus]|uniref:Nuclear receptor n=1 Tax=Pristionchus pacificus TaxID=54126 RepID=A0A2A6D2E5_PRIPA|nr:hypothetical protein PRIPAC_96614 [Pristionchus pacificus]|eukprot:PDM84604.1 nuclear receptor [Pristionchus pacificus]
MLMSQGANAVIRDCLVCGSRTNGVHLGVDVCRACAVFYRRVMRKKQKTCRSLCSGGRTLNCSKCRLARLQHIFQTAGKTVVSSPVPVVHCAREDDRIILASMSGCNSKDRYATQLTIASTQDQQSTPLLARVRAAYEKMSYGRLMGELCARKIAPSPMCISSAKHPVYPATFGTMHHANRLLIACLAEFAACSFPEFNGLDDSQRWAVLAKFMYAFRTLDNSFRASRHLADWPNRLIAHSFDHKYVQCRRIVERANPSEEEFIALLILLFWTTNGLSSSDELTRLSDMYRGQIFQELHTYYSYGSRDTLGRRQPLLTCSKVFDPPPNAAGRKTGESMKEGGRAVKAGGRRGPIDLPGGGRMP